MKIKSVDKLASTKRIRKAALAVLRKREFKGGYSYPVGGSPLQGMYRAARHTLAVREIFSELESAGLVRLDIRPDDTCQMDDLKGDSYNPDVNPEIPRKRLEQEEKDFEERVNREGVCGIVGEYRTGENEQWEHADSCWGFVGDDWKDSGYDVDCMSATIDALRDALANSCPHCGRPQRKRKA